MSEELSDCQQQLLFEREEKSKAIAQVESLCAQAGKLGAELQAVKAAGLDVTGDIDSFKVALEEKQTELNKLMSRIEELEAVSARLSKERDLINKKMDRVQAQKDAETSALKRQLEICSGEVQAQVNERDRRINELMEELGNREVRDPRISSSSNLIAIQLCASALSLSL
jgi:chromosome segregation ATPase